MSQAKTTGLKIIPLGGLGEIGLNMMVMEYDGNLLVIDCGLMFPEDYMLGVDLVIPDFTYLYERKDRIKAVILTHGHEDHIGAVPYLLGSISPTIYGTNLTLELVKEKLKEHHIEKKVRLKSIRPRQRIKAGPFRVEFFGVNHSILDGVGLAIETPEGLVVHTSDFKMDFSSQDGGTTDLKKLSEFGDRGVLALLSDSTNVEYEGFTLSEREVGKTLASIFQECKGRIIVGVFASNMTRIQQVIDLGKQFGRRVVIDGKSMRTSVRIGRELGYIKAEPKIFVDVSKVADLPDDKVVMITTGSQGEAMSVLARIAAGAHKYIRIKPHDTVILSSKFIPGNERAIAAIINDLYRHGARVVYEKISAIHCSGHAHREEIKMMIQLTRPRFFLPIHGEMRHLVQNAELASSMGIPKKNAVVAENGDVIQIHGKNIKKIDRVTHGRIFVDGKGIGDVGNIILSDRKTLSEDGVVILTMILSSKTRQLIFGPELSSRGFIYEADNPELLIEAKDVARQTWEGLSVGEEPDWDEVKDILARNLRRFFNKSIKRRPLVLPTIVEI